MCVHIKIHVPIWDGLNKYKPKRKTKKIKLHDYSLAQLPFYLPNYLPT